MMNIINEKMVAAVEKRIGKVVVDSFAEQDGKDIKVEVRTEDEIYKAVLSERKNQHGSYYRVMSVEEVDILAYQTSAEEPVAEESIKEEKAEQNDDEPKDEIDENEAMANLQAAQKFSETKNSPVYVMSNGKRTTIVKTDANKSRHEKYGYWTAAIFENGVQVSA